MSFRGFAETCVAGSALALMLALATTTAAAELADQMPGDASAMPAAPSMPSTTMPIPGMPMPTAPDMRPEWRGASAAMQPDGRARDAWLRECRRRTEMYYDGSGHHRHHRRDRDRDQAYVGGYDYCEAYFDDYYRTYTQPGYGYAHAYPTMVYMQPVAMAPVQTTYTQTSQPVEEVVTEEYVPIRRRVIPHRRIRHAVPDKRIRVAP